MGSSLSSRNMGKSFTSGGGGTYSDEVGLWLIFYKEMSLYQKYNTSSTQVPVFCGGMITEVLGKGKYKVKLQEDSSVITAKSSEANSSNTGIYIKGAFCLMLLQGKDYLILAVRQTGVFRPSTVKYPV